MYFVFICQAVARIWIESQAPFCSTVASDQPTWIQVPSHCRVRGHIFGSHPHYLVERAVVFKPLRKMFEYEYDVERGILIGGSEKILDLSNYPDFSTQTLGIGLGGLLVAVLFKLFA